MRASPLRAGWPVFKEVIEQKRALVQELRQGKYADVIGDNEHITFVKGRARLLDAKTVATDTLKLKADAVLIATKIICQRSRPADCVAHLEAGAGSMRSMVAATGWLQTRCALLQLRRQSKKLLDLGVGSNVWRVPR